MLASLGAWVHPWYEVKNDAALYVATAGSLAEGEGYRYLGVPFRARPPGFSLLIAPIVGRAGADFRLLNLAVAALGAAAVLLLYLRVRVRLGWLLALLVALSVWLNPRYQQLCNSVLSDVPGLLFVLVSLAAERWAARAASPRREALLGLCIGCAALVRSLNALLLPALWLARVARRRREGSGGAPWPAFLGLRCGVATATAALVLLPWSLRNATVEVPADWDQTALDSYATAWLHEDKGDPDSRRLGVEDLLARTTVQSEHVARGLACRLQSLLEPDPCRAHPGFAIPIVACLLLVFLRRPEPGEAFALAALAAVTVYFGFQDRLLLPVYVLALPATVEVLRDGVRALAGERSATALAAGALAALIAADFSPRHRWPEIEARDGELRRIAAIAARRIEPGARVASAQGSHYALFLGRPVYSLRHGIQSAGGRPAGAEAVIDRREIDTVLLAESTREDLALIPYFTGRYPGATHEDGVWVIRVRPRSD